MRNALALAVAVATAGSALAGNCDDDSQCTYTVNFNGKVRLASTQRHERRTAAVGGSAA